MPYFSRYLPPKVEWVVFCSASASQASLYESVSRLLTRSLAADGGGTDHLAAVTILRKLCSHPALLCTGELCSLPALLCSHTVSRAVSQHCYALVSCAVTR